MKFSGIIIVAAMYFGLSFATYSGAISPKVVQGPTIPVGAGQIGGINVAPTIPPRRSPGM